MKTDIFLTNNMTTNSVLCRLCALKCEKYVNIYEEDSDNSNIELETKIGSCLQIWVSKDDMLPKTICQICFTKLTESFEFFQNSNKAQFLLGKIYQFENTTQVTSTEEIDVEEEKFQVDNLQYEAQEDGDDQDSEIQEEADLPNPDEQDTQPDVVDLVLDEPVDGSITLFEPDDSKEKQKEFVIFRKKSHQCKKSPNFIDNPADPADPPDAPLAQLLEGYPWSCTLCEDTILDTMQDLQVHYAVEHQRLPIFKCVSCDKQYNRYRSFSRHIKQHGNPKRYTCDICKKTFAQKSSLRSHASVHSSDRPYSCKTCGKSFKNFGSLHVHGRMHLPDQAKEKYRCDLCEKEFTRRHTLETHRKIHTGERNFICDICGKSFVAKGSLDYHLLSHAGNTSHVCPTCGRGFKTARLLTKHATRHLGIKPHQCDVCGKQFRERGPLREHSRIHTGAMPYSCEVCGKRFRFKGILTVHKRQHTGERPYSCLECLRYFTNWANYNKHMKRIHHRDTSDPHKSRHRSRANVISQNPVNTESTKSLANENKTNQYSISTVDTPEIFQPSPQPLADVDHS